MFDRFTDRARTIMGLAKKESQRLNHEYIGTEHLLLGILQEGTGVAANVLKDMNIDFKRVRGEVEKIVSGSPNLGTPGNLPFTLRAKRVFELAVEEAADLGHDYIGSEHLLLGLIKENEGIAARVLLQLGLKLDKTRAAILRFLGVAAASAAPGFSDPPKSDLGLALLAFEEGFERLVAWVSGGLGIKRMESAPAPVAAPSTETLSLPPFPRSDLRIGVVGAGGIVMNAHLPAYAKAGYRVTAICDVRREAAEAAAAKFSIPLVVASVAELVARSDVDVIDVAVPEHGRPAVIDALLKAAKPTLLQKPLAYSLEEARRLVDRFEAAKIPLAVNQNLRWSPEFRAAKQLVASGQLGRLFDIRWTMRNTSDRRNWAKGSWYSKDPRFQILSWSEHHLDAFRFLLDDEAETVYCALPRRPDQNFTGEICGTAVIHFKQGCHVTLVDSNAATPGRPEIQECDLDGTGGSLYLKVSEPRRFEYWLEREVPAGGDAPTHAPKLDGVWYPDGFAGAMGDFLEAVEKAVEPSVSGRRNLGTMALIDACYRSAAARQAVAVTAP